MFLENWLRTKHCALSLGAGRGVLNQTPFSELLPFQCCTNFPVTSLSAPQHLLPAQQCCSGSVRWVCQKSMQHNASCWVTPTLQILNAVPVSRDPAIAKSLSKAWQCSQERERKTRQQDANGNMYKKYVTLQSAPPASCDVWLQQLWRQRTPLYLALSKFLFHYFLWSALESCVSFQAFRTYVILLQRLPQTNYIGWRTQK